jgi:hypothetical protein
LDSTQRMSSPTKGLPTAAYAEISVGTCEFRSMPASAAPAAGGQFGWFIALRYQKKPKPRPAGEPEQYQLFDTPEYSYRVFVTNMKDAIALLAWFYQQRSGAENLIKEAHNDVGLAVHPSARWAMNCIHFPLAMLAYNLNCWLMLFNREEEAKVAAQGKHHTRHNPAEVSVSGGQDLAARGPCGSQLQRSLPGTRSH